MHASTAPADEACGTAPAAATRPAAACAVSPHAHRLGLAPKLCRRGLEVSVRLLLRAWGTRSPVSWGQHETTAEEIEACTAKHLALEHFQAIDVPLDRTGAPRQVTPALTAW